MSYEMLMEIVLSYLNERKGTADFQSMQNFDSEQSKNSINHTSAGGSEDLMTEIENIQNDKTRVTQLYVRRNNASQQKRMQTRFIIDIHDSDEDDEQEMQQQRMRQQSYRNTYRGR